MHYHDVIKRRTKIVCTIGPATGSASVIEQLIRHGMNVARLNLSHGTHDEHVTLIQTIRERSGHLEIPVAILMDLPGPKYRTGVLKGGKALLRKGKTLTLTTDTITGDAERVSVNLSTLPVDIHTGDTILIDDGALQLKAVGKEGKEVTAKIITGGILTEHRGLVVPGMRSSTPFLNETLLDHLLFSIGQHPDYIAVSFVSDADDVLKVRDILDTNNARIPVISKIEKVQAVKSFDAILKVSDGIMVARGDLGVDIPLEQVPFVQKDIIRKCNKYGKPVITATQMLESMVHAARPTRAEVTDVANSIFDGTDAAMLSAETSVGEYPVAAVQTMAKIARETEKHLPYHSRLLEKNTWIEKQTGELICYSACHTADILDAKAIIAFTISGSTAYRVSKYRPAVPVLALTPEDSVLGRLMLYWGVYPFKTKHESASMEGFFLRAAECALKTGIAGKGDLIVIISGVPSAVAGTTNMLKVDTIP